MLLLFNNRMTSAEPISVAFSGELLAMVVIGGMRSFLGPALGALFFVIFRDYLSSLTENWLFVFGLLFVAFIVFSPRGLVGVYEQATAPFRKKVVEDAAMAARRVGEEPLPAFLRPAEHVDGAILEVRGIVKHFGGIKAVEGASFTVRDRTLHALIGPNGAGKTTAFNLISGMYAPDSGDDRCSRAADISGLPPEAITQAGIGRSFQITNLFPELSVEENIRLAVQGAPSARFNVWTTARGDRRDRKRNRRRDPLSRRRRHRARRCRLTLLWRPAPARYGPRARDRPHILLLDEPLAGLAAAERERIGALVKHLSRELPVLLVEHDIDRVFRLADHVTVMNDGKVLVDGNRGRCALVEEGAGRLYRLRRLAYRRKAARNRGRPRRAARGRQRQHLLRQEPHPQRCLVRSEA